MTPALLETLDAVRGSIEAIGLAPKYDELARQLGISKAAAHKRVQLLIHAGKLKRLSTRARGIDLADAPDLRTVPLDKIRGELGRRGLTLDALKVLERVNYGRGAVTCAVDGCAIEVRRGHLMCRDHWFAVPIAMRGDIVRAHAAGDAELYGLLVSEAREIAATLVRS